MSTIAGTGQCGSNPPIGSALTTQLTPVQSIVVDSHDQVYFVDQYFGALYVVSTGGVISKVAELNPYGGPNLLAIDSQDRIYFLSYVPNAFGVVAPGAAPQMVNLPSLPLSAKVQFRVYLALRLTLPTTFTFAVSRSRPYFDTLRICSPMAPP